MEYEVSLQTIAWFNERRNSSTLEISPKFQRRAVWLDKERSALMGTILTKLPFPEIYIQVETDHDSGSQNYIIVDGQQRITSILKFIDGEVSLPQSDPWDGQSFKDLTPEQKRSFWDYKIVVRALRNTNDAEIRDLFQRLNTNNIALNDQELRNARFTGRFKAACERLADDPFFQSVGLFTPREVRRMEDIEFVSELLVLTIDGVQNKKDHLEDYYTNYNDDFPNETQYELEFRTAVNLLQQISDEDNQAVFKTKSNFYSLFGACHRYFKETKRAHFMQPASLSIEITKLLSDARGFRGDTEVSPEVREYADAVSRAASDRSRRAKRQEILLSIIKKIENI